MCTLKTENEAYGYFGTMAMDNCADAEVRAFLDSRWGRHFADSVHCFLGQRPLEKAVEAAVEQWNGWTLSLHDRRELGIPTPMRYLQGMVYAAAIYTEAV